MTKTLTEQIVHIQNDLDVVFAELVKLEKKLEIATKALKKIIRDYEMNRIGYLCVTRAKAALKGMEGVK